MSPADAAPSLPAKLPTLERGTYFDHFPVPDREPSIQAVSKTPLSLFRAFVPEILAALWVEYSEKAAIPGQEGPPQ
jgi:hypothetical protein